MVGKAGPYKEYLTSSSDYCSEQESPYFSIQGALCRLVLRQFLLIPAHDALLPIGKVSLDTAQAELHDQRNQRDNDNADHDNIGGQILRR